MFKNPNHLQLQASFLDIHITEARTPNASIINFLTIISLGETESTIAVKKQNSYKVLLCSTK